MRRAASAVASGARGTLPAGILRGWRETAARRREALAERRAARRERPAPAPEPAGELTGLRLLLDQLDALLRDPTLTNALRRLGEQMKEALRALAAALHLPRIRLPSWLRLPRLPAWLVLPLLLLLLGLGLASLLSPDDEDRRAGTSGAFELALPGAGMPALQAAPDDPPRARIALVVGDGFAPQALRRELRSLGLWLDANHAPGTRVVLVDAETGRASAPVAAGELARAVAAGPRSTAAAAVDEALGDGASGRRLLVGVGAATPQSAATTLAVTTRRGAPAPGGPDVRRGERAAVAIDDRQPDALASSVARALIAISGQREER